MKGKIFDVTSQEFMEKAHKLTKAEWDFTRLYDKSYRCCVKNCFIGREYGYYTCGRHRLLELKYFDPTNKDGSLFWSHIRKKEEIKRLEEEEVDRKED